AGTQANAAIQELPATKFDAQIEAEAQIDPVDKQALEEVKIAEAVQEDQKELEAAEKLEESLGNKEPDSKKKDSKSTEKEEKGQYISQTPEWKAAVKKVEDARKRLADLPVNASREEHMRLALELADARQELQKLIEVGPPRDVDTQYTLFDALDQKIKVTDENGNTGILKLDEGG